MSRVGVHIPLISLPAWLWLWLAYYVWWLPHHLMWRLDDLAKGLRMVGEQAALDGSRAGYMLIVSELATSLPTLPKLG